MKKKNRKYVLISIFMFATAIASIYVLFYIDNNIRYLVSTAISTFIGIVCIYLSKTTEPIISDAVDERDIINIEKSSRTTIQLLNYLLSGVIFICLTLYGATKNDVFLVIAITEIVSILILLIISLFTQGYYEKTN